MILLAMGSESDWETLQHCAATLDRLKVGYQARVLSAHRTPQRMLEMAERAHQDGFSVIIAGAGGAAHLPGMMASATLLPVIGVPVTSRALNGLDSLLSIVQMPGGVPVATMAIGKAGAVNAALMAARILAVQDPELRERLIEYRQAMQESVLEQDGRVQRWQPES
ncbi:5-(carboxyamino)imidazole ribonucleotide mutase [Sulfobacillus harzensis]|uniref:N5-carboxyaminoimidazole ribonucleotide mutase n=1 Tax=Sulfobacillus harzensis TaxID=2729629 RepID=A0A7Y0L534_9FIRM|nr:5-(carboxyamino)imidazole ribonucleotide mutase [Sulfobacillus harzensis]NMP23233.1 5-(carboxyamino)imidazole ribonucleotide mutase [Sulfobacillus harzensis]